MKQVNGDLRHFPLMCSPGYLWERCHTHHLQLFLFATIALLLLKCSNTLNRSQQFVLRAFIVVAILRLRLTGFGAQGYVPGALVVCLSVECRCSRLHRNCITEKWIIIVPSQSSLHKCKWRVSEGQSSWFCERQYVCDSHDLLVAGHSLSPGGGRQLYCARQWSPRNARTGRTSWSTRYERWSISTVWQCVFITVTVTCHLIVCEIDTK